MVMISLQLSEDVTDKARSLGLLTDEKLSELIEREVMQEWEAKKRRRAEAVAELNEMTERVHTHMRETYGDLTEEEAQAMIDGWIAEAEAAIEHRKSQKAT